MDIIPIKFLTSQQEKIIWISTWYCKISMHVRIVKKKKLHRVWILWML